MIRSLFALFAKSKLSKWWTEKSDRVRLEYEQKEKDFIAEFDSKYSAIKSELTEKVEELEKDKRDVDDLTTRVEDRRKELARVNEELKVQIRLIEAKSSPDVLWASAFSQGFSKAWDMMIPVMTKGLDKVCDKVRAEEIELSFPRIDMIVEQRIKETGNVHLMEQGAVDQKKREFQLKLSKATSDDDKKKLSNYITVLDWVTSVRNGN